MVAGFTKVMICACRESLLNFILLDESVSLLCHSTVVLIVEIHHQLKVLLVIS